MVGSADIERLMGAARAHAERDGRTLLHMNCISYRLDRPQASASRWAWPARRSAPNCTPSRPTRRRCATCCTSSSAPICRLRASLPAPYASGLARDDRGGAPARRGGDRHRRRHNDAWRPSPEDTCCRPTWCPSAATTPPSILRTRWRLPHTKPSESRRNMALWQELSRDDHEVICVRAGRRGRRRPSPDDQGRGARHHPRPHVASLRSPRRPDRAFRRRPAHDAAHGADGRGQPGCGLGEFAADFFARPVRVARSEPLEGMPAGLGGAAFSTSVGLLQVALDPSAGTRGDRGGREAGGYLRRMGQWLREGF